MDTNTNSSQAPKPQPKSWALWAGLAMLAAGACALAYVLFAAASKPETASELTRFAVGEMQHLQMLPEPPPMPSRAIKNDAGDDVSLADFHGEVLVVNFWATWCAPCKEEMPTLGALQRRFAGRLRVIPISVDSAGDVPKAKSELRRLAGGSLSFYGDISRGVLFDVQAPGLPVTIIYARDGRELARLPGGADWAGDDAAALMEAVLEEQP